MHQPSITRSKISPNNLSVKKSVCLDQTTHSTQSCQKLNVNSDVLMLDTPNSNIIKLAAPISDILRLISPNSNNPELTAPNRANLFLTF